MPSWSRFERKGAPQMQESPLTRVSTVVALCVGGHAVPLESPSGSEASSGARHPAPADSHPQSTGLKPVAARSHALRPAALKSRVAGGPEPTAVDPLQTLVSRLRHARNRYALAASTYKRALREYAAGVVVDPVGFAAVRKAHVAESAALEKYMRALRFLIDLTVYGRIPERSSTRINAVEAGGSKRAPLAERLTPREIEVLKLIASGDSTTQIATELGIALKTVQYRRTVALATEPPSGWQIRRVVTGN